MRTPTERTLKYLRKSGYVVQVVEVWNPYGGPRRDDGTPIGNRKDLFGFIDILALLDGQVLAVQSTAVSGMSARYRKITGKQKFKETDPTRLAKIRGERYDRLRAVNACLEAGWTIAIFGFDKGMQLPKIQYVELGDLAQDELAL